MVESDSSSGDGLVHISSAASSLDPYYEPDPFYSEETTEFEQEFNNGVRVITVRGIKKGGISV